MDPTSSIRVVLFDVGGVLVELTGVPALRAWTDNRLSEESAIWAAWLGSPTVRAFETGRITPMEFANRLIVEMQLSIGPDDLLDAFSQWPKALNPGVKELLNRIGPEYVRATLCNTNVLHWPRFLLMGIEDAFHHHFASHLLGTLKPDREAFEHVVARFKCEPSHVLFLDDLPQNVQAAKDAGLNAAVARGVHDAERVLVEFGVLRDVTVAAV
jgi:glucose-1-phosphatase